LVSLSGQSGSGKTTIAHVLARFLDPTTGGVLWGDVAYENMQVSDSRKLVAINGDSPHVFATSLFGNLRVADRNLTSELALEVLEEVGLGDLISTMPNGLEAEIGGTYPRLSGGERRRLGVARALLMRAKVQIFDEPTEGLDPDAVSLVQRALLKRAQDSTVLVLSHDARIIEAADIHMKVQDGSLMVQ
jgi:ATP-binding cassette subfamily C protein CydC